MGDMKEVVTTALAEPVIVKQKKWIHIPGKRQGEPGNREFLAGCLLLLSLIVIAFVLYYYLIIY